MACQVGATPVLSLLGKKNSHLFTFSKCIFFSLRNFFLLGGLSKTEDVQRPFVTEHNIIMYLDMVNERVIELKSIAQFVDAQAKIKEGCCKNQLFVYFFEKI